MNGFAGDHRTYRPVSASNPTQTQSFIKLNIKIKKQTDTLETWLLFEGGKTRLILFLFYAAHKEFEK